MPTLREQALAPMSRSDAERLLPTLPVGGRSLERRVLHARCLKNLESFDIAWAELSTLLAQVRDPLLAARVAIDLIHLAYYLVRGDEMRRLLRIAERQAATDPLLLAELRLGESINATAANEITKALRDARWADDALSAAPRGRSRDLVATRVSRQLAHVLSHAGDHAAARAAAEATARNAARVGDAWEIAWATYTAGFVEWMAGSNERAVEEFTKAEAGLRSYGSSVWRYTLFCLARAKMERGELAEGDRLARQSATGAPEDLAHLALLRGEAEVAERILERAPKGLPADEHFRDVVRGIVAAHRGDPRRGVRMLDEGAMELESRGWSTGLSASRCMRRSGGRSSSGAPARRALRSSCASSPRPARRDSPTTCRRSVCGPAASPSAPASRSRPHARCGPRARPRRAGPSPTRRSPSAHRRSTRSPSTCARSASPGASSGSSGSSSSFAARRRTSRVTCSPRVSA